MCRNKAVVRASVLFSAATQGHAAMERCSTLLPTGEDQRGEGENEGVITESLAGCECNKCNQYNQYQ